MKKPKSNEINKEMLIVRDHLETLYAVELLEYHNKNWLSGDNKTRNETRRALLKECLIHFPATSISTHG